jgi:5-methylcytosine-specific restriction endonuclease McrA
VSAGVEQKTCTKCGKTKAREEFSKRTRSHDGLVAACKVCNREYRQANAEKIAERRRKYEQANAEKISDRKREYRQVNAEKISEYQRAYHLTYYPANAEKIAEYQREYEQANAEKISERRRKYYRANPDVYSAARHRRRARLAGAPHEPYNRTDIFAAYGNTCAYCDAPAEHIDHVVPISKGGADAAHNLLPACAPCNLSKSDKSLADWALSWVAKP